MTTEEIQACRDGYIYIHDRSARRDTMNCCLFNVQEVLKGGFEMGNLWYNEPKTLDVAFDVIGDIVLSAASQQYGGFTVPNIELILEPYAEKSYEAGIERYEGLGLSRERAEEEAMKDVKREFEQGFQGLEYKFNSVSSSRGDYPFITMTAGTGTGRFAKMATISMLDVRRRGQGKEGHKKPVLFPKLVFLYDKNLHGPGCELEDVFEAGIRCSRQTMYPDWLSLTGEGYIASMYKKYGKIISPMGCRAFLSPWYKEGGIMTKPTVFGMNGSSLMAGGEAGREAVLPLKGFYDQLENILSSRLNTSAMEKYLAIIAENSCKGLYLDDGTLVGHLLPAIDSGLGKTQKLQRRLSL